MPKLKVNGKDIEVKEGATLIEAFMALEENIAHFCWHPGLSVAGVCRMCMVEVEGNPKLQIACNIPAEDGMVVSNKSDKVKEAVKWGLEFHLINHPLDCPICDQSGECGLQEYYMTYGKYDSAMAEPKVKKRKVVDLGERVVLDTERCILCSRCVRFTDEVSKSNELGIFQRGDCSEIGTYEDKPLNNNYSLNTVDICPVGALTSKDFRFKQRTWYLKSFESICNGCSTGCNIKIHYNNNGLYRVLPMYNKNVNGHWMCDKGREIYKFANKENRLLYASKKEDGGFKSLMPGAAVKQIQQELKGSVKSKIGVLVTGQYTNEEYNSIFKTFNKLGWNQFFHWVNEPNKVSEFDGILYRGDKNPNTKGLKKISKEYGALKKDKELFDLIDRGEIKTVIVLGPENISVYPDFNEKVQALKNCKTIWFSAIKHPEFKNIDWTIPVKSFVEKSGTFTNFEGLEQKISKGPNIVSQALTLEDIAYLLEGKDIPLQVSQESISEVSL